MKGLKSYVYYDWGYCYSVNYRFVCINDLLSDVRFECAYEDRKCQCVALTGETDSYAYKFCDSLPYIKRSITTGGCSSTSCYRFTYLYL